SNPGRRDEFGARLRRRARNDIGNPATPRGDAMRRVLPFLLPLVLITGCDGGGLPPGPSGPVGATAQLRAGFPLRGLTDTIVIDAIDRLPLRAADLVAPGGAIT